MVALRILPVPSLDFLRDVEARSRTLYLAHVSVVPSRSFCVLVPHGWPLRAWSQVLLVLTTGKCREAHAPCPKGVIVETVGVAVDDPHHRAAEHAHMDLAAKLVPLANDVMAAAVVAVEEWAWDGVVQDLEPGTHANTMNYENERTWHAAEAKEWLVIAAEAAQTPMLGKTRVVSGICRYHVALAAVG